MKGGHYLVPCNNFVKKLHVRFQHQVMRRELYDTCLNRIDKLERVKDKTFNGVYLDILCVPCLSGIRK